MPFKPRNESYWNNKFLAYFHDPIDKPLQLKGHEERAKKMIELFGLQIPNNFKNLWSFADGIASGFERGTFPGFSTDRNKNGYIDFKEMPVLTHPVQGGELFIDVTQLQEWDEKALLEKLAEIIGEKPKDKGYSSCSIFKSDPESFAVGRFLYTHLCLRFKLAHDNVAGFGALWHKLPADTRIPDHSIWQHNALVSALVSCMNPDGNPLPEEEKLDRNYLDSIGIMVFTITPVQSFIAKARKLRDYWTGSVLLSWLAFEGIKWIIENLGPDHVLYPSLIDQPLVTEYLKKEWQISERFFPQICKINDIATFPNKAMVLIPLHEAQNIGEGIQAQIQKTWRDISNIIVQFLKNNGVSNDALENLFYQEIESYWDISWVSYPLISSNNVERYGQLIDGAILQETEEQIKKFKKIIDYNFETGKYYPVTNSLSLSALNNLKLSSRNVRPVQNGKKCTLCGELEALTDIPHKEGQRAHEYQTNMDDFWEKLRKALGISSEEGEKESSELKEKERLCAVCLVKRLLPRVIKNSKYESHLLYSLFKNYESFPSTAEISLYDYFNRNKITERDAKKDKAQKLYNDKEEKMTLKNVKNQDKYYALLLMDGDNMGKLISGETIPATWGSVIHPDIRKRMQNQEFEKCYRENWKGLYNEKRLITPSIHGAISEALGDFSLYGVPAIIRNHQGCLIYAGGDDVFAIVPMNEALNAAKEIATYYSRFFTLVSDDTLENQQELLEHNKVPLMMRGKLSHGMGKGKSISISAGILICHYKEPLTEAIRSTHALLDSHAKEKMDRNTCALELRKRNGGSRFFTKKWEDPAWDSFHELLKAPRSILSNTLLYGLEAYKDGMVALRNSSGKNVDADLDTFIGNIIEKSIRERPNPRMVANIRQLMWSKNKRGEWEFSTDVLKIIAFMRGDSDE